MFCFVLFVKLASMMNVSCQFVYSTITDGSSSCRDRGMKYIVGKDWRDLFDVVIVQADKPNFFNDKRR